MKKKLAIILLLLALPLSALARDYSGRRYGIVPNTAANRVLIRRCIQAKVCIQTSLQTIRLSCDGTAGVVKFNLSKLVRLTGRTRPPNLEPIGITWLTHMYTHALMRTPEWDHPCAP